MQLFYQPETHDIVNIEINPRFGGCPLSYMCDANYPKFIIREYFMNEEIVISEEFGSEKTTPANYSYFIKRYPECGDFTYVGDNLEKEFVAPYALGWKIICMKNDGRNIHKQMAKIQTKEYNPDFLQKC